MEEPKKNKGLGPKVTKGTEGPRSVLIVFRPGRDGEGAIPQGDGTWLADEVKAAYWVSIGYAEYFNEGV
jgi:hypothetical protein